MAPRDSAAKLQVGRPSRERARRETAGRVTRVVAVGPAESMYGTVPMLIGHPPRATSHEDSIMTVQFP